MPLMRIRSVEIVFEDDMSTCALDLASSDSDDSTKCMDEIEHLQVERDEDRSATLNAGDLSDDNSVSLRDDALQDGDPNRSESTRADASLPNDESSSLNASELGDSGRFTEDASTSHFAASLASYDDALLSHSLDFINVDKSEVADSAVTARLSEYVDSDSASSDDTAVCENRPPASHCADEDQTACDTDLQYDSIIDMGKF